MWQFFCAFALISGLTLPFSDTLATILTDEFTGYTAGDLAGNNGGGGSWTSPWGQVSGSMNVVTGSGGIGAVSTVSSTDPFAQATLAGSPAIYSRTFSSLSNQSNIYFSVLLNIQQAANAQGGIDFYNGAGDQQFVFGKTSNVSTNWGITVRPGSSGFDSQNSSVTVPDGVTILLVGRVDQINRVATLWVNPNLTLSESANIPALTLLFGTGDTTIDTIRLRGDGNSGAIWEFDNLSIFYQGDSPFEAGNPTNSTAALRITAVVRESNNIRIKWTTYGGRTNVVQATNGGVGGGYSNNFTDLSPQIIPIGNSVTTTNYLDTGGATNKPARYYRIRISLP